MRAGLVTKVMEHITVLVNEWFSGIKPQLLIACPHCVESKAHTTEDQPIHIERSYASPAVMKGLTLPVQKGGTDPDVTNGFVFNFNDCVWISRTSSVVYCPAHGDVPLKYFVPDVVGSVELYMCVKCYWKAALLRYLLLLTCILDFCVLDVF